MPAPKLGMWLFLASEAMFFIGLLGSFIVLESAGSQHQLFVNSSHMLSRQVAVLSIIVLICSSIFLRDKRKWARWIAVGLTIYFLLLQASQFLDLLDHRTLVVRNREGVVVLDGQNLGAKQIPMPNSFDVHQVTVGDFSTAKSGIGHKNWFDHLDGEVLVKANYGPSRNNFFAMYFLMSAAHVLHLLAGIIAVLWFMLFAKGKLPDAVQIYWHFVNAVGVISFLVLYFG